MAGDWLNMLASKRVGCGACPSLGQAAILSLGLTRGVTFHFLFVTENSKFILK